ncbi:hypothetical protein FNF31_06174 [Cafeteria roenbergensis]|uniref:Uncharacterized protein n=1 Tax=Cafeteria roenbergensis TaxID=33653 RepID=A0A5A8CPX2_CAFRO|nr:hypothetical protein FNF31_06174 [Cafeteria roenbergensis]
MRFRIACCFAPATLPHCRLVRLLRSLKALGSHDLGGGRDAPAPVAFACSGTGSGYFLAVANRVLMLGLDGSIGPSLEFGGNVTALCTSGEFLFAAFEAIVPSRTAVPAGHVELVHVPSGGRKHVTPKDVCFSHRGPILALETVGLPGKPIPVLFTGCSDGSMAMWISEDGTLWNKKTMGEAHLRAVTTLAWHPDMRRLLSGSLDMTVAIWDPASVDAPKKVFLPDQSRHQAGIASVRVARLGPDAPCFISADQHGYITAWRATSLDDASPVTGCEGYASNPLTAMEVLNLPGSPGPVIVSGLSGGSISMRTVADGLPIATVLAPKVAHSRGPTIVCPPVLGEGRFLTAGGDHKTTLWQFAGPGGTPPALVAAAAGPAAAAAAGPAAAAAAGPAAAAVPFPAAAGMPAMAGAHMAHFPPGAYA